MLYAHGPDLCRESDLRHAMANCFEALIGKACLFVCAPCVFVCVFCFNMSTCHVDCDGGDVGLC